MTDKIVTLPPRRECLSQVVVVQVHVEQGVHGRPGPPALDLADVVVAEVVGGEGDGRGGDLLEGVVREEDLADGRQAAKHAATHLAISTIDSLTE